VLHVRKERRHEARFSHLGRVAQITVSIIPIPFICFVMGMPSLQVMRSWAVTAASSQLHSLIPKHGN
jgi:hypothetical protein